MIQPWRKVRDRRPLNEGRVTAHKLAMLADIEREQKPTQPLEARALKRPPMSMETRKAFRDLLIAVNGVPYHDQSTDAVIWALRWLRANPARAQVLLAALDDVDD